MKNNLYMAWGLIIWMVCLNLFATSNLAPDLQIPIHWNIMGEVDGYGSLSTALWMPLNISFLIIFINWLIPHLDPRKDHSSHNRPVRYALSNMFTLFAAIIHQGFILLAFGQDINMIKVVFVALGLLYIVLGNYIPKTRSNFFIGIRTPWTLSSEENWVKTHRLAGKLMLITGLITIVTALIPYGNIFSPIASIELLVSAVLLPVGYSWYIWQADKGASEEE